MTDDKETIRRLREENENLKARLYVRPVRGQRFDPEDDGYYNPGCGADDTRDSRGRRLRPTYNDAGEHFSM